MMNMSLTLRHNDTELSSANRLYSVRVYAANKPVIEYVAHLPGGMIQVRFQNGLYIMNPLATIELGGR
jgi:hypothetical protein